MSAEEQRSINSFSSFLPLVLSVCLRLSPSCQPSVALRRLDDCCCTGETAKCRLPRCANLVGKSVWQSWCDRIVAHATLFGHLLRPLRPHSVWVLMKPNMRHVFVEPGKARRHTVCKELQEAAGESLHPYEQSSVLPRFNPI